MTASTALPFNGRGAIARDRERFLLPVRGTIAAAVVCAATTAQLALLGADLPQAGPAGSAAVKVTVALSAVLALHAIWGRFGLDGRLDDLALIGGLGALAVTVVVLSALPEHGNHALVDWAPAFGYLIAAVGLAVASWAPAANLPATRRVALLTALIILGLAASAAALPGAAGLPLAGYLAPQVIAAVLFAIAALGLAWRAERRGDQLLAWIGLGCVFAGFASVHELALPTAAPGGPLTADLLQLAFGLAVFAGAMGEVTVHRRRLVVAAVIDERRRIARDLHDGLAQELAYIRMETRRMEARQSGGHAADVALAAERALTEVRHAIAGLRHADDDLFATELSHLAEHLAARAGARLRLDVDARIEVQASQRDQLLRIVREAVSNGVRHGGATEVSLELSSDEGLRMAVRDNGKGFKPGSARRRGSFGLTTMRERAQALGGDLTVQSAPGEGTLVEVVVP